jgi:hypothetical protein
MALSDDITAHIAAVQALADDLGASAVSYADQAITAASGWASTSPSYVPILSVTIPSTNDPSLTNMQLLFKNDYDDIFSSLKPYLDNLRDAWLTRFFPEVDDCLRIHEDDWICDVLQGNYDGIPAYVEEAIWNRGRDRELRDSSRMLDEATTAFAARGFSYPPGALNAVVLEVGHAEREKISSISREVAIKNIDVQIETIKFAVSQATALRLGVQQALNGYLDTYLKPPALGIEHAGQLASAQARLWDASGAYYGALINAQKLKLDAYEYNSSVQIRAQEVDVQAFMEKTKATVNAALSSAQYFANAAAGALAALNTMSHIWSGEQV